MMFKVNPYFLLLLMLIFFGMNTSFGFASESADRLLNKIRDIEDHIENEDDSDIRSMWQEELEYVVAEATVRASRPKLSPEEIQARLSASEGYPVSSRNKPSDTPYQFSLPTGISDGYIHDMSDEHGFRHYNIFVSEEENHVIKMLRAGVTDSFVERGIPYGAVNARTITVSPTVGVSYEWFLTDEPTGGLTITELNGDKLTIISEGYQDNVPQVFEFDLSTMAFTQLENFDRMAEAYPVPVDLQSEPSTGTGYPVEGSPLSVDSTLDDANIQSSNIWWIAIVAIVLLGIGVGYVSWGKQ